MNIDTKEAIKEIIALNKIAVEAVDYLETWVFDGRLPKIPGEPFSEELIEWWCDLKGIKYYKNEEDDKTT